MENEYQSVIEKLNVLGVQTHFQSPHQLVCTAGAFEQGPFGSNSVWLTVRNSQWFIVTWSPRRYRVPSGVNVAEVCAEILKSSQTTIHDITAEQRAKYGLIEEIAGQNRGV